MSNSPSVALHKTDPSLFQKNAEMISPAKLANTHKARQPCHIMSSHRH